MRRASGTRRETKKAAYDELMALFRKFDTFEDANEAYEEATRRMMGMFGPIGMGAPCDVASNSSVGADQ